MIVRQRKVSKLFLVGVKNKTAKVKLENLDMSFEDEIYSSGSSVRTLSAETLTKDLTIFDEWSLSVDLKLPNRSTTKWRKFFSYQYSWATGVWGDLRNK